ncbi:MAG TPA: hypothetical protein VGM36_13650 [Rhizomicrobium sp.]
MIGTLAVPPGGVRNAAPLRVEKSADCAGLHGEYRGEQPLRDRRAPQADRRAVSRTGTFETAPLWYGPRLRAPFVAQIIGQVLGHAEAAAQTGYRADTVPVALVVDRNA